MTKSQTKKPKVGSWVELGKRLKQKLRELRDSAQGKYFKSQKNLDYLILPEVKDKAELDTYRRVSRKIIEDLILVREVNLDKLTASHYEGKIIQIISQQVKAELESEDIEDIWEGELLDFVKQFVDESEYSITHTLLNEKEQKLWIYLTKREIFIPSKRPPGKFEDNKIYIKMDLSKEYKQQLNDD